MAKKKLITHNGKFHTDDVFACATLCILLEKDGDKYEVIRTRDEEVIKAGDYVFDVGGVYDKDINRFDHHQIGGAGKRKNNIEYASFGLVWEKYGGVLCESDQVAEYLDDRIVASVDAQDNGQDLFKINYDGILPYSIWNVIKSYLPTWKEDENETDKFFLEAVEFAKKLLSREIVKARHKMEAEALVEDAYKNATDKRLIILDQYYPWHDALAKYPEPLFVVAPRIGNKWDLYTVSKSSASFEAKKDLPLSWAGLTGEALAKVTGVEDAVFCHRARFLAVAGSKGGILKMAEIALNS
jgi:uncharacterized UPF0160 family protein